MEMPTPLPASMLMPNIGQFFYLSNQLTLLRLVFIPFVVLTILYARYETALILVLVAGLTDGMDGLLARHLGQQTTLGQFLDPIADKLLLNAAFIALVATDELPLWLVILVFSRDVIILATSLVMLLATSYRPFRPSMYGKASTAAQVATILFALAALVFPGDIFEWLRTGAVYTAAGFTVASGLQYAWLTGERLRRSEEPMQTGEPERERREREEESRAGRNRLH